MTLQDLGKYVFGDINIEVYNPNGILVFNDVLAKLDIKDQDRKVLSIVPQHTSKMNYLEITVY